jgi:V/A-type H+-transporting ATPase subunit C
MAKGNQANIRTLSSRVLSSLNVEFWRWQVKQLRKDPLGIEVAMAFRMWQIVEWQILTALAVGLSLGLRPEQITQSLIPLE